MLLAACALPAFAAAALGGPDTAVAERLATASARLQAGEHQMSLARSATTSAARLDAWRQAVTLLRQARIAAWTGNGASFETLQTDAYYDFVRALDGVAETYFARKSLSLAKDANDEALSIAPADPRALNLAAMIRSAEHTDIYDPNQGATAVERIRARRAASGMALRDRGIASRR
jgi:hypothetical protein